MNKEHPSVKEMWSRYLASIGEDIDHTTKTYTAWHFCDNERAADELAQLVLQGTKKATTSLLLTFELEHEPVPQIGDYSIVIDWRGQAQCIIQTTRVEVLPFQDVTAEFAAREGEGDKSLAYWRRVHREFFARELETTGREPDENMLVVCEDIQVVYKLT